MRDVGDSRQSAFSPSSPTRRACAARSSSRQARQQAAPAWRGSLISTRHHRRRSAAVSAAVLSRTERGLLAADQLDIDLGQQLRIEQRAVLGAMAVVDAIAAAERVERIRSHRMLAPGQRQRVDDAARIDRRLAEAVKLGIDEAHVEAGIVGDQLGAVDEGEKLVGNVRKRRLADKIGVADAVHGQRFRMDRAALRIDVTGGRCGRSGSG